MCINIDYGSDIKYVYKVFIINHNMVNILAVLATIAGVIMSLGYYPQAIKILKRKSAKDVSPITYLMFFPGVVIWLLYGISLKNIPLIVANIVAVIGCGFVLFAYYIHKNP